MKKRRTIHCSNRLELAEVQKQLEAQGADFETHHEPWDYQPFRVVVKGTD